MKLTKSQERKLRKKLKLKASAEDVFVKMYLDDIKRSIGKRIRNAQSMEEVDKVIESIDVKSLKYHVKALSNKLLERNNSGLLEILKSIQSGLEQINKKKKDNKLFNKEMTNLVKNKKLTTPLLNIFENNMMLISNLPKEVYKILKKAYLSGKSFRGTDVEKDLYERLGDRAKLITRTESAKVNTALTEVRSRSVGVKCYIWSTSGDQRVRDTHSVLDNVLVFWDDAPTFVHINKSGKQTEDRHHSGNIYNCRCIALPVFELEDIHFPVKVAVNARIVEKYINSKHSELTYSGIKLFTKSQFLAQYGKLFISSEQELKKLLEKS